MNDDLLGYPARRLHTLTRQDVDVMKGRRFDGMMACVELFADEPVSSILSVSVNWILRFVARTLMMVLDGRKEERWRCCETETELRLCLVIRLFNRVVVAAATGDTYSDY